MTVRAGTQRITIDPHPSWEKRWLEFLWHLGQLRAEYSAVEEFLPTVIRLQIIAEATMGACYDTADWFDKTGPVMARGTAATLKSVDPLRLCGGYVNTVKHGRRRKAGQLLGELITYECPPLRMLIDFEVVGSGSIGSRDVLELAEQCETTWRGFFSRHGIVPKSW